MGSPDRTIQLQRFKLLPTFNLYLNNDLFICIGACLRLLHPRRARLPLSSQLKVPTSGSAFLEFQALLSRFPSLPLPHFLFVPQASRVLLEFLVTRLRQELHEKVVVSLSLDGVVGILGVRSIGIFTIWLGSRTTWPGVVAPSMASHDLRWPCLLQGLSLGRALRLLGVLGSSLVLIIRLNPARRRLKLLKNAAVGLLAHRRLVHLAWLIFLFFLLDV